MLFYHKKLAEEFKKQFTYLDKNTKKCIKKKLTRIDKNGEEITKSLSYSLLRARNMWQAHYQILSIIFVKEFIKLNEKYAHDDRKCETCWITFKKCDCFLDYTNRKDDLIEYKCLYCKNRLMES